MCCLECSKYEICEQGNPLESHCCPKCPEYYNCVGSIYKEEDPYKDGYYEHLT